MVFTSIPVYSDQQNWNQQAPETPTNVFKTGPTNRPASMTEQARMAKVAPPDPTLPCPRCESTNTKFCYYNNYSLTQPRHFCKTCRRYWTRGGALRNVPVGGGLRRNKRSKSASKSSSSSATSTGVNRQVSTSNGTASSSGTAIANHTTSHPFISPLHHMSHDYNTTSLPNLGLGFSNMHPIDSLEYQVENNNNGLSIGLEPWRLANPQTQNLPFLPGMYSLEGEGMIKLSAPGLITQFASVKMEDSNNMPSLSLPRAFLDNSGNDIYCTGGGTAFSTSCEVNGGWTMDLTGFNSTSIQGNIL